MAIIISLSKPSFKARLAENELGAPRTWATYRLSISE
jgi:hypothetical protein